MVEMEDEVVGLACPVLSRRNSFLFCSFPASAMCKDPVVYFPCHLDNQFSPQHLAQLTII